MVAMVYDYRLYGLAVRTNLPIPHLHSQTNPFPKLDLTCHFNVVPPYSGEWIPHKRFADKRNQGAPDEDIRLHILTTPDETLVQLAYSDNVRFVFTADTSELWVNWEGDHSLEDISLYFLNPVMGFCLRMRQQVCLHASAVDIDGQAILITAPSGWGKSTLAYRFSLAGYPVISDDISVLTKTETGFAVQPGYPYLRLWPTGTPDAVGTTDSLPQISSNWEKRFFDLQAKQGAFAEQPVPLRAIYFLRNMESAIRIEQVSLPTAVMVLMDNTYMDYLLDDTLRRNDFQFIAQLASKVPVKHLIRRDGLEFVDETVKLILANIAQGNKA